jgi:hypothetical protein
MVLYLCVLIVFSLRRESLKLILAMNPSPRWFYHTIDLKETAHGASSHRGAGETAAVAPNPVEEVVHGARQTGCGVKEMGWECSGGRGLNGDERRRWCTGAAPF